MEEKILNFCEVLSTPLLNSLIEIIEGCIDEYPEYTEQQIYYFLDELRTTYEMRKYNERNH